LLVHKVERGRIRLTGRATTLQRLQIRVHFGFPVTDEPSKADKGNTDSGDTIFLQSAPGAASDLLYIAITE
jgi:hypothetical protein